MTESSSSVPGIMSACTLSLPVARTQSKWTSACLLFSMSRYAITSKSSLDEAFESRMLAFTMVEVSSPTSTPMLMESREPQTLASITFLLPVIKEKPISSIGLPSLRKTLIVIASPEGTIARSRLYLESSPSFSSLNAPVSLRTRWVAVSHTSANTEADGGVEESVAPSNFNSRWGSAVSSLSRYAEIWRSPAPAELGRSVMTISTPSADHVFPGCKPVNEFDMLVMKSPQQLSG
mmetsp:Transcript_117287/g.376855  ORF Transcript_117287/g.376855 Transcript_117287/m.376855 type:complete len:235 (-) Transcript_117287:1675-2379(-)